MARRLYLHIGTMKSGTTYLQQFCNLNRDLLAESGVLWTIAVQNFRAVDDLLGTWRKRPGLEGAWDRLTQSIASHDGDALVSNELLAELADANTKKLVAAFAPAEVHVVITARDLGKVLPSHWQEGCRNTQTATWSDFIAAARGDKGSDPDLAGRIWRKHGVAGIVKRWSKHVPIERITVVTVPRRPSSPLELAERFLSVMGIELTDAVKQPTYLHEKMGANSAELMRLVNERMDFDWLHHQWGLKQSLARYVLPARANDEPPIRLNKKQLKWAAKRAREMACAVTETGVRVVGDIDDLVPDTDGPRYAADPTKSSDAELLDAAVDGIIGLASILADMRIEYDALIRELEPRLPSLSAAEHTRFDVDVASLPELAPGVPPRGRLLRWKLRESDPALAPAASTQTPVWTRIPASEALTPSTGDAQNHPEDKKIPPPVTSGQA